MLFQLEAIAPINVTLSMLTIYIFLLGSFKLTFYEQLYVLSVHSQLSLIINHILYHFVI
jgi:hypothetical protein